MLATELWFTIRRYGGFSYSFRLWLYSNGMDMDQWLGLWYGVSLYGWVSLSMIEQSDSISIDVSLTITSFEAALKKR